MKAFKFIVRSVVSDMNATALSQNLKITHYKAMLYLQLTVDAFIIKQIDHILYQRGYQTNPKL